MQQILSVVFAIFIALYLFWFVREQIKIYALNTTSNSMFATWIRSFFRFEAKVRAWAYIVEYTRGFKSENHQVRDIMTYHLSTDRSWEDTFVEWGMKECESQLADLLDRVREFIKEWTKEQYLYTSQLELIWKAHKDEYLSRGQIPNVPTSLRPQQL